MSLECDLEAWTAYSSTYGTTPATARPPTLDDAARTEGKGYHTCWGHGGVRAQSDYAIGDKGACRSWGLGPPAYRSDHAVSRVIVDGGAAKPRMQPKKLQQACSLKGWAPIDDAHRDEFRDSAGKALGQLRDRRREAGFSHEAGDHANAAHELETAEKLIAGMARQHGRSGVGGESTQAASKPVCPRSLTMLERAASRPNADHDQRR